MSSEHIGSEHDLAEDIGIERGASAGVVNAQLADAFQAVGSAPGPITMLGGFARSEADGDVGNDGEVKAQRHWWGAAS